VVARTVRSVTFVRAGAAAVLHDAPAGLGPNLESRLRSCYMSNSRMLSSHLLVTPQEKSPRKLLLIPSQNYGCARNAAFVLPELNLELHGDERAGPGRLTTIRDIAEENQ
jgi:hypothetical protein